MIDDVPFDQRPHSERHRLVAKAWVEANREARLLEKLEKTELAKRKNALMAGAEKTPATRAEELVRASDEWAGYITRMIDARAKADRLKAHLENLDIERWEINDANATRRAELNNLHHA